MAIDDIHWVDKTTAEFLDYLIDRIAKESIMLMDMMGQKFAVKSTTEEINKEMEKAPKTSVNITGETKEILGYTCKKAVITFEEEDGYVDVLDLEDYH